eukprot:2442236-Amphidinium_carterae.1
MEVAGGHAAQEYDSIFGHCGGERWFPKLVKVAFLQNGSADVMLLDSVVATRAGGVHSSLRGLHLQIYHSTTARVCL